MLVSILKHGIIRSFWFENNVGETVRANKEITLLFLISSGGHFVPVMPCRERSNGFNKTVKLPIKLTSLWSDWIVAFAS